MNNLTIIILLFYLCTIIASFTLSEIEYLEKNAKIQAHRPHRLRTIHIKTDQSPTVFVSRLGRVYAVPHHNEDEQQDLSPLERLLPRSRLSPQRNRKRAARHRNISPEVRSIAPN